MNAQSVTTQTTNPLFIGLAVVGVIGVIAGGVVGFLFWKKKKEGAKEGKEGKEGKEEKEEKDGDKISERSLIQPPQGGSDVVEAAPDAVAEEDKVKTSDNPTPPPAEKVEEEEEANFDDPFPPPDEPSDELTEVVQGNVPDELAEGVAWLNSLNTTDVDSCQNLLKADIFKFILKAVKGIRNEDGEIEETLPYHALSILAQIYTRGLSRNEQRVAENAASEFRFAHGLNVVYDVSTSSTHTPSKQLAAIITAFTFAYEPLTSEYQNILPILTDIILEYNESSSSYDESEDPQPHEAERLVALALHALTLLLHHADNVHLILEDYVGREADEGNPNADRSTSPAARRRGFSSTSPQPQQLNYDPSSPNNYPTDSPQSQRAVNQGEVPDLPQSTLQDKIFELVSAEDKNIAAWAIRFYSVQALHMTLNEKRAFVSQSGFFEVALQLLKLPLNDETLPLVENTVLALYNICLNKYDKGKSFILKLGIAKQLFTTLVRIDFKALSNPDQGLIKPLSEKPYTPQSLSEPLTSLSPVNSVYTVDEESRYVDHQVHTMGIVEHTLAIYKSLHHNIQSLEYLVKMGIATPISNILYNYHRKISQSQVLHEAAEESYGRFLANTLELLRYLAALGVDEVIGGKDNELRRSLEKIQGEKVQENLLKILPWESFDFSQELDQLDYTNRGLLDIAFAFTALYAGDDAPDEARPAFDFIRDLRNSDSPLVSKESPSLYVKYYNYVYANVNNAQDF